MVVISSITALGAGIAGKIGLGAFFAKGFGAFVVGLGTQVALGALTRALAPKPKFNQTSRGYTVTQRGSALDHQIVYGRARVGGVVVYDSTTGADNNTLNRVIAFTGHEIESFDEIYINGEKAVLSGGNVTSPSRYNGKVFIHQYLGTEDQTADPTLISETASLSDGKWTENHRLRGIAYLYIRFVYDQDVFPNGIPEVTATIKGKKVYDPREGTHDADDASTWEWSDNPALCLRDYLTSGYGLAEDSDSIDDTLVTTAANVCDQTLSGITRYTCNGAFITSQTPYDTMGNMVTSMGGLLWYAQGKWRMKPAYWTTPTLTLDEDDLRSSVQVRTRHSRRDNFNTVRGTFRGEESDWQVTDYPEVSNAAFLAADNGQESVADVSLPFTDNSVEARRIARIALERNRQQITVTGSFGLRAFKCQVGDVINLSLERFGWTQKTFEVVGWTFGLTDALDLQVQMTLREISESVFDEVDDGVVYERDNTTLASPFITVSPNNLTVSDGGFTTEDGNFVNSFIVSWDAPNDAFVDYYVLEWRIQGESKFKSVSLTSTQYQISPVIEETTYEIRVKAVNGLGVSGPYATTTAAVGGDVIAPGLPISISATGGFKYITIEWTNPTDADLNYIEVWENDTNTTIGATLIGETSGSQFVRTNLNVGETKFYFLRAVDYSGNVSGYTAGVSASTTFLDDPDFENGIRTLFEEQGLFAIEDVNGLPPSGILGQKVFNRQDGKLYEWNGSAWVLVISSVEAPDIDGQLATNQIELDAITNDLIANDAIQAENIKNLAINEDKIADNAVTTAKIANAAVQEANLADGAATEAKIATSAITETKISSGAVTTPKVAAGAITAGEIAAGSIITSKIAAGAVTAGEIAAGTITSSQIATNTIIATNIAAGAITANEIATGAITSTKVNAGAITADKIASNAVTTNKIAAGAVTANEITAGTITSNEIAAGTITANEISGNTITGDKISANTITGGLLSTSGIITNTAQINDALISNAKIQNGAITTAKIGAAQITNSKIGDLQVNNAKIANLTVGGEKIQNGAITGAGIAGGGFVSSSGNWVTVAQFFLATLGGRTVIAWAVALPASLPVGSQGTPGTGNLRVVVNGVVVDEQVTSGRVPLLGFGTSASGSTNVALQVIKTGGDVNFGASGRVAAVELKK